MEKNCTYNDTYFLISIDVDGEKWMKIRSVIEQKYTDVIWYGFGLMIIVLSSDRSRYNNCNSTHMYRTCLDFNFTKS